MKTHAPLHFITQMRLILSNPLMFSCLLFLRVVFKDENTPSPFVEEFPGDDGEAERAALPDHIYMDAMGFGMGNCCLQVHAPALPHMTWHSIT